MRNAGRGIRRLAVATTAVALLAGAGGPAARAEVLIERLFMPFDATPSSFAIGLPGGVAFCFDPVRCSVSYVWTGGFLDLSPTRPGPAKFIQPAKLLGPVVYRETGAVPLRRGDPAKIPVMEFTGYTLREAAVEFRYTIDGAPVRDEIRLAPGGRALQRRLRIDGARDARWWHVVDGRPPAEITRDADGALALTLPFAAEGVK